MVEVRVGIAADTGRHAAAVTSGLPSDTPGLAAAMSTLLNCPVEPSFGGFRCRQRMEAVGLSHSGVLDLSALRTLAGPHRRIALTVQIPASPAAWAGAPLRRVETSWLAGRTEFRGVIAPGDAPPQIRFRAGFEQGWLLGLALLPAPLLLGWLVRRPEPRWAWVAGNALWLGASGATGMLLADPYFWSVPSIEGAFLRCVGFAPLLVLVIGQARWLHAAGGDWRIWAQIILLMLVRPSAADWMSMGETLLANGVAIAMLGLVSGPMLAWGRERVFLPEFLAGALQERLRRMASPGGAGGFDIRLDRQARRGEPGGGPRFGSVVVVPSAWTERLQGSELEAAVLLAVARTQRAPLALLLVGLVLIWIAAEFLTQRTWAMAAFPVAALGWFALCERAWDRRVAADLVALGERPEVLQNALAAVEPEWGSASGRISRAVGRLAAPGTPVPLR